MREEEYIYYLYLLKVGSFHMMQIVLILNFCGLHAAKMTQELSLFIETKQERMLYIL